MLRGQAKARGSRLAAELASLIDLIADRTEPSRELRVTDARGAEHRGVQRVSGILHGGRAAWFWLRRRWPWFRPTLAASKDVIGADAPIRTASDDLLERGRIAERIADVLETPYPYTGRVFAIRADWGVGKSSLMNLVIEILKARRSQARWLEFNPWQWGDAQAISRALFLQIAGKLGGSLSADAIRRARLMRRYGAVLLGAGGALKGGVEVRRTSLLTWLGVLATAGLFGLQIPDWVRSLPIGAKDLISWGLGLPLHHPASEMRQGV